MRHNARAASAAHTSPLATSLRWPLTGLCTLLALDAAVLVFQNPIRRMIAAARADGAQASVASLIAQPRLNAPNVRAPWQETLEAARLAVATQKTDVALQTLADAETQIPQQPFAMAELANQYEKLGARERALNLWSKIHQFGQQAGVYSATAEAKLVQLSAVQGEPVGAMKSLPAASASQALGAATAATAAKPSAALKFGKFTFHDSASSTSPKKHFTLSVPVISLNTAPIEAKDVAIEVQFYDQTRDKKVERTNANIGWKWVSNPTDWTDKSPKTLQVEYRQGTTRAPSEQRGYYGYVAGVYYKDKLQDVRAEPTRLGQQYPPPRLLPKESNP